MNSGILKIEIDQFDKFYLANWWGFYYFLKALVGDRFKSYKEIVFYFPNNFTPAEINFLNRVNYYDTVFLSCVRNEFYILSFSSNFFYQFF